ncbi:Abi family protein [Tepidibacillus fermentans]|uniref:Abortive infection bacteriophage resistance protein n=1 Tax=Tepidibacillus fermentans TaxID=1281767 RepID=A0A4R3KGG0_9BACI|nr:Abi family protein [Tepidibacillus fermentans]TCS82514.1 abortive infection bacteriophage resistance protein [Tepidibacillus fermentans]
MVTDLSANNNIKKPTTFEEQIEILKARNMVISDVEKAKNILKRISYYRLSAYMLTLKENDRFYDGISLEDVYNLYEFDKKLRNLLLGMLESIEITFRTHIAYLLAHKYGPIGYLDKNNFQNDQYHNDMILQINKEIDRSDELFIKHYKDKYKGIFPIWVAIEVTSFGLLSKIFSNMKNVDKKEIAESYYNIPYRYIESWLYVFSTIRNICAHYGRLYNRKLTITPRLDKKDKMKGINNNSIFSVLYIMGKVYLNKPAWESFVTNIKALIEEYENVDIKLMGFPAKWEMLLRQVQ